MGLKEFNSRLQKRFPGIELIKADGYFYWDGPAFDVWPSEYVCHFNHLSCEQWLAVVDRNSRDYPL